MDGVRIQIIRGCDAQGQGGTIVDDATGVIGSLGGVPVLDMTLLAFQSEYGLLSYDNPAFDPEQPESEQNRRVITVTPYRNLSYRLREFAQNVLKGWAAKLSDEQATAQSTEQGQAAVATLTIVENLPS